jgi:hypothetical protein
MPIREPYYAGLELSNPATVARCEASAVLRASREALEALQQLAAGASERQARFQALCETVRRNLDAINAINRNRSNERK